MSAIVPLWILGGPFLGLLVLAFAFKGPSAMGGSLPRLPPRTINRDEPSAPLLEPMVPGAPRRIV